MRTIRIAALVAGVAMVAVIAVALVTGDLAAEGRVIWGLPWGRVSLVDIYAGLVIVGAVIVVRERRPVRWVPWLVALVVLGNLATAAYVLVALRGAISDDRGLGAEGP